MLAAIEAEFSAIVNDARSIPEKLAALVGLHTKAQEIEALEPVLEQILGNGAMTTTEKVSAILSAVGKL